MNSGWIIVALLLVISANNARAEESAVTLSVTPDRCIALQQGQTCYATLNFRWETPNVGEFCLFSQAQSDPIVCWVGSSPLPYRHEFASDENVNYEIRLKKAKEVLARTLVKISWVYKSNTKSTSRWRLF